MLRLLIIIPLTVTLPAQQTVSFNRDVRPILSDNCFQCHGPDEKKREAGLRLDVREAALKGGDGGPAFVEGKPDVSEMVKRITSADADELMPPRKSNKTLQPEQVAILKKWIAEGAKYEGHWAFVPSAQCSENGATEN
jgi:mono/diheme cytochrome c family protein